MMSSVRRTASLLTGVCRTGTRPVHSWAEGAGLVLQSRSTDVFQNLALEDWIEANVDLRRRGVLLLWRNRPAVVVGRHQNPWVECDVRAAARAGIPVARRRSGGGTVYHDLGNLNLTFFTSKKNYDRRRNLKVITDALRTVRPQLDVHATDRLDIVLDGRLKISGSASRLRRDSSYHHCTLLHSADRSTLSAVLRPSMSGIHSNATPSVPSPVANLVDHAPTLRWEELLEAVVDQYNQEFGLTSALTSVDPSDESSFPGIGVFVTELSSWDWTFGKTPKFSVQADLDLSRRRSAQLHLEVKNGRMASCRVLVPPDWIPQSRADQLARVLVGERFCRRGAAAAVRALLPSGVTGNPLEELAEAVLRAMG